MAECGRISYSFSWFTQLRSCFLASLAASGLWFLCRHFLALWISLVISTSFVPLALGVVRLTRMRLLSCCSIVVCIRPFQPSAANCLVHIHVYVELSMNAGEIFRHSIPLSFNHNHIQSIRVRTPCQTVQHNGTVDILQIKQLLQFAVSMQSP